MGSTNVGLATRDIIGAPIVIKNITATAAGDTATTAINTRSLVPKGAYTVSMVPTAGISIGTSTSHVNFLLAQSLNYTVLTQYADNGRPGPFLIQDHSNPKGNILVLQRDAYFSLSIRNVNGAAALDGVAFDVTFTPTYSPYKSVGTITANRTQTGDLNSTSTNDVNVNCIQLGWDYDRNLPFVITSNSSVSGERTRATDFYLFRANASGTWDTTYWSNTSASSGNSWFNGSGLGFRGNQNNLRQSSFFIKNNELHNLDMSGLMTDASGNRWGWIKGNISAGTFPSGSTLTMSPGHTNTAFSTPSSQIGTAAGDNIMIYFHDRVNNKVIYNGAKDITYSGTYANYGWRHNWAQWDIQTNVVDFQNVNGVVDPRIAGQGNEANMAWTTAVPNGSTGFSYGVGDNAGNNYLARWTRTGSYTGVGNFQTRNPYAGTVNLGAYNQSGGSTNQTITYMPNGVMLYNTTVSNASIDYLNTSNNSPISILESPNAHSAAFWGLNSAMGTSQNRNQIIVVNNTIVLMEYGYMKATGSSIVRRYIPITVYVAPATAANLGAILPGMGGIGSTVTGNPGISNGV